MNRKNTRLVISIASLLIITFLLSKISIVPYKEKAIVIKKEAYSERIDVKIDSVYKDGKLVYQGTEELTEGKCYITARSIKNGNVHRTAVSEETFKYYHLKDTCTVTFNCKALKWKKNDRTNENCQR